MDRKIFCFLIKSIITGGMSMSLHSIFGEEDASLYKVQTHSKGADGSLPLTSEMLLNSPSGDLFGLSQNVGMGWKPSNLLGKQVLIV